MDQQTIRRRRAVLALILIASATLLAMSFAGQGGTGAVSRGFSSIGDVASGSLKPARDLRDWVQDTRDAKGRNGSLAEDRDELRRENTALYATIRHIKLQAGIDQVIDASDLRALRPVQARVILTGGPLLYDQVTINKGTTSGLRADQPVFTAGGIVGKVTTTGPSFATIALVTSRRLGVQARVRGTQIVGGVSRPGTNPLDLVFRTTDPKAIVRTGAVLATRGTASGARFPSVYPPDVTLGRVVRIDEPGTDTQRIHVRPAVDVRNLDLVVVLTRQPG